MNQMIFIATSNQILLEGLVHLTMEYEEHCQVETFDSIRDLLKALKAHPCAVAIIAEPVFLLPISVVARILRQASPGARIVVLHRRTTRCFPAQLYKQGVLAVLCGCCTSTDLRHSIQEARGNRCYVPERVAECLVVELSTYEAPHSGLSERNLEIFLMLIQGLSPRFIAGCLSTSSRVISSCKAAIYDQLSVNNVSELIQYALAHNLLDNKYEWQKSSGGCEESRAKPLWTCIQKSG